VDGLEELKAALRRELDLHEAGVISDDDLELEIVKVVTRFRQLSPPAIDSGVPEVRR
jgi:hypothetical protein